MSEGDTVEKAEFSQRVLIRSILNRADGGAGLAGQVVQIGGWVRTGRKQGKGAFAFLEVNDGSCAANLQMFVEGSVHKLEGLIHTGTCVHVEGMLEQPPVGKIQKIELRVSKVLDVGTVDAAGYPLPKTRLNLEKLRDFVHLRPRINIISSVARIRNALLLATHTFFQKHGFLHVHTPIITSSDCEGAGEMFQVTTLITEAEKLEKELLKENLDLKAVLRDSELVVNQKAEAVRFAKLKKDAYVASKGEIGSALSELNMAEESAVSELNKAEEKLAILEKRARLASIYQLGGIPLPKMDGKFDYALDFFARRAFLTVSGQLQLETYACALSNVYTFGPTFRAEHSHTSRHLSEFWMVESEIAFADIQDDMNCAEAYVRYLCQWLLDHCLDDMQIMADRDPTCIDRLKMVAASSKFHRITYTEAVAILEEVSKKRKFEHKVEWGVDLASEHERYLCEEIFESPVIVYNYPKEIKAFYMKLNDDKKTVAAMDMLVPKVGELIGGSQREDNYEVLRARLTESGLPVENYEWYLDLRRYGTVKHSGFGLGFERMMMFATGIDNIRDVIPFPRLPGRIDL